MILDLFTQTDKVKKDIVTEQKLLKYALNSNNQSVYIMDVANGAACNCHCPICRGPLIAKQGKHNTPHFAHKPDENGVVRDCPGAYMTMKHIIAEDIIEREKKLMFPKYYYVEEQVIQFDSIEREERNDRPDLQPDIVGIYCGIRFLIEIKVSHAVDETKKQKIIDEKLDCLEIDISDVEIEDLKDFLLGKSVGRIWVNNVTFRNVNNAHMMKRIKKLKKEYPKSKCWKIPNKNCKKMSHHNCYKCYYAITWFDYDEKKYVLCSDKPR